MELIYVKLKEMKVLDFELNFKTLVQQGSTPVFKSKCHPNPFNCSNNFSLRAPDNDVKCKHLTILCLFRLFRFHNWILQPSRSLDGCILFIIQTPISLCTFVTWLSTLLNSSQSTNIFYCIEVHVKFTILTILKSTIQQHSQCCAVITMI